MNDNPLVTICVPTYNCAQYLRESLISIFTQDYKNKEIFIIDNCSTDNTEEIIDTLKSEYDFTYIKNERNLGAYGNYTKCFSFGKGNLISVYHSDDVYFPTIVSESVAKFIENPELGLVFSLMAPMTNSGKVFKSTHLSRHLKNIDSDYYYLDDLYKSLMVDSNFGLATPTMMMKRELFFQMGGFELDKFNSGADLGLWMKISEEYPIAIISKPLIKYRRTANQALRNKSVVPGSYLKIMENYLDKYPKYSKYYNKHFCVDIAKRILISCSLNKSKEAKKLSLILTDNIKNISIFSSWHKKELIMLFIGISLGISLKFSSRLSIKIAILLEELRTIQNKHIL